MSYLFRQKLVFDPVAFSGQSLPVSLVYVVEPEEALLDLYCKYLLKEKFAVKGFRGLDMLVVPKHPEPEPDVAVVNSHLLRHPEFTRVREKVFPEKIKIISIGSAPGQDFVQSLMSMGVSSHLERRLSRPGDLVEIVRALLYH